MNSILAKIESIDSFDELANLLQSKDLIKEVHDFLHHLNNTEQRAPTDPTEQRAPTAPTDPTEQTAPTAPTDPTEQTAPTAPTAPTEQTEQTESKHSGKKQKISRTLNVRDSRHFLTAYMIYRFPKDTLGSIGETTTEGLVVNMSDQDNELHRKAIELIECAKTMVNMNATVIFKFKQLFDAYINLFNLWKTTDRYELKNSLIREYHKLSVNIMNERETLVKQSESKSLTEEEHQHNQLTEERIQVLEECKESLLSSALILGGHELVNEVNQYSPVVIDLEELCKAYGNAFWDVLTVEYSEKRYDKIFVVLENILKLFETLYDTDESGLSEKSKQTRLEKITEIKEKIDVDFIRQQLEHDVYSNEDMYNLCMFMLGLMKTIVAAQFDENISTLEQHIGDAEFLPIFLREISTILQITVSDTLHLRKALQTARSADQDVSAD